ncbi:hypothetical protein EBR96_05750 [bacterium]|nr:hypothetical protein [bacterium]
MTNLVQNSAPRYNPTMFNRLALPVRRLFEKPVIVVLMAQIAVLSIALLLRGRLFGVVFAILIFLIRFVGLRFLLFRQIHAQKWAGDARWLYAGLLFGAVVAGLAFYAVIAAPYVGDRALVGGPGFWVVAGMFYTTAVIINAEAERPDKYLLPLIVMAGLALLAFGYWGVGPDSLLAVLLLLCGVLVLYDGWFEDDAFHGQIPLTAVRLLFPLVAFACGRAASQYLIQSVYPSGLIIQYYYTLPGLFAGFFIAFYIYRFQFRRWLWVIVPILPIFVSLVMGIEGGLSFWISFIFGAYMLSYVDASKVMVFGATSLGMTVLAYPLLQIFQLPLSAMSDEGRSAIGISAVVFWVIIILFGNQSRRDWGVESIAKLRLRRRKKSGGKSSVRRSSLTPPYS